MTGTLLGLKQFSEMFVFQSAEIKGVHFLKDLTDLRQKLNGNSIFLLDL